MKLCKDCEHYRHHDWANLDRCSNPDYAKPLDLVRGSDQPLYCDTMRLLGRQCGPDARGFQPKSDASRKADSAAIGMVK